MQRYKKYVICKMGDLVWGKEDVLWGLFIVDGKLLVVRSKEDLYFLLSYTT